MTDYTTMQARIADEIHRSDLTSPIQSAIQTAIAHYERERFYFNDGISTTSTVANQQQYALPSDVASPDSLKITVNSNDYVLIPRTWAWMENINITNASSGYPTDYALYDEKIWLYSIPNAVFTMTLSFQKRLAALSNPTDTNAWMVAGEELIRQRAKAVLKIDQLNQSEAKQEALSMFRVRSRALSILEGQAWRNLKSETDARVAGSPRLAATNF